MNILRLLELVKSAVTLLQHADLTTTCPCRQTHTIVDFKTKIDSQRQLLRLTFQLAKQLDKILVLHGRDKGTGETAKEVIALLHECDLSNTQIHEKCERQSC